MPETHAFPNMVAMVADDRSDWQKRFDDPAEINVDRANNGLAVQQRVIGGIPTTIIYNLEALDQAEF